MKFTFKLLIALALTCLPGVMTLANEETIVRGFEKSLGRPLNVVVVPFGLNRENKTKYRVEFYMFLILAVLPMSSAATLLLLPFIKRE